MFTRSRTARLGAAMLVTVAMLLPACATSPLGKGIQTGEATKLGVETAMREVIRLDCGGATDAELAKLLAAGRPCERRISKENYSKAASAYAKYEVAQKAYADGLIAWDRVKTAEADARVKTAYAQLQTQMSAAADLLCAFQAQSSNLAKVCQAMGR